MKRILSLLIAMIMVISACGMAETAATPEVDEAELAKQAEIAYMQSDCEFALIEADETTGQPRLTYIEGVTPILDVDGLKFKDLDKDGELDAYEDWRLDTETRAIDLYSKMTVEEQVGLLFCVQAYEYNSRDNIASFKNNCQLFNLNGDVTTVVNIANNAQKACEEERLGIPMVMASDREYNAFGGYLDKAHNAFGNANDPELAYDLAYIYGTAMNAVGIHVTFEPYAEEIGAQYGENPELLASIAYAEIKGLEDSGFASCTKHWIGRGGDSSFGKARSVAQNFDNWLVGWKAALEAGCEWIMTNCGGTGLSNNVDVKWDKVTMNYLRETLGFEGVVVTDWWALGMGSKVSGVNNEGYELSEQSAAWLYNEALLNGTTIFGGGNLVHGTEIERWMSLYPDVIIEGIASGEVDPANVEKEAMRVLRFKFNKGLFENPYRVVSEALVTVASEAYAAEPWEIVDNESLRLARDPHELELAEKLQAESAVLVKNDGNILPLAAGTKVYIETSTSAILDGYKKYIGAYGTIVETMEEADVVIGDFGSINDAAEMFIDDAHDLGKTIILTLNGTKPTQYTLENADAIIYMSYSQRPDHGTALAAFTYCTEAWVYADLLFGTVQPGGIMTKEIARGTDLAEFKDLANDMGASYYVRLMLQATMEDDTDTHSTPNNWGDPLVQSYYGMTYGASAEWKISCVLLPTVAEEKETLNSRGQAQISTVLVNKAAAGEPFTVTCLLRNTGDSDGITNVEVLANGEVVGSKLYTCCAGSWRVVEVEATIDAAGEYTISVGDASAIITIE